MVVVMPSFEFSTNCFGGGGEQGGKSLISKDMQGQRRLKEKKKKLLLVTLQRSCITAGRAPTTTEQVGGVYLPVSPHVSK